MKQWNDKVITKITRSGVNIDEPIAESYEEAKTQYTKLLEEDVKPAFKQFDRDFSGFIDKDELK